MEQVLKFDLRRITLSYDPNETNHADMDICLEDYENKDSNGDPNYIYLSLKEHEAVYLANAILSYIEYNRKDNERYNQERKDKV